VIQSQAVLIAIGVDWEGRRQVLGVELANRESCSLAVSKAVVAGVWKPPREETAGRLLGMVPRLCAMEIWEPGFWTEVQLYEGREVMSRW
jgi:hypothetical protein